MKTTKTTGKKITICFGAILIFLIVFISGCTGGGTGTTATPSDAGIKYEDIHKGSEGLSADFFKDNPPSTVLLLSEGITQFGTVIMLENKGAANINDGFLKILSEKDYITLPSEDAVQFTLKGKSIEIPIGEKTSKQFLLGAKISDANSVAKKVQVSAVFCYDYETAATFSVCVDPDILGQLEGQKVCTPKDETSLGQGAPLVVSKVETQMLPKEDGVLPVFTIYFENKGDGQVLNPSSIKAACTNQIADQSKVWNMVAVSSVTLGETQLMCTPLIDSVYLRLKNKEDFIRCQFPNVISKNSEQAYLSTLRIKLNYGYTFTKSKTIELKRTI